jgi:hypothetical protein
MSDSISQAIEAICNIVPPCPGDSRNDSMVRRLELLLQVATTMADAIPENGGIDVIDGAELTVKAHAAAERIDARTRPPRSRRPTSRQRSFQLPPGYNLPSFSETALEASGND